MAESATDVPALFERIRPPLPLPLYVPPSSSFTMSDSEKPQSKPKSRQLKPRVPPVKGKQSQTSAMGKGHRYQRSSSGAPFNSSHRKRNFAPRTPSAPFHYPRDGSFEARPNPRFGFALQGPPPPGWQWQPHHPGRFPPVGSPPPRPFDTTPPAMPYDFPQPHPHAQPFYPPMPYVTERGFGGPFRRSAEHEFHEFQNRLFLDEYRFPGPHQAYQPPHVDAASQSPLERPWRGENPSELEGKPLAQNIKLRGDAPEFVPRWKSPANEESDLEPKVKEPCWFVVSST